MDKKVKWGISIILVMSVVILIGGIKVFDKKENKVIDENRSRDNESTTSMNRNTIPDDSMNSNEAKNEITTSTNHRSRNNVSLTIQEGSLTKTGATIVITDTNESPYTYGEWFRIDKKQGEEWKELKPITDQYAFNEIAWIVGKDGTVKDTVDWSDLYGTLEKGEYRLVKEVYDTEKFYIWTEFSID